MEFLEMNTSKITIDYWKKDVFVLDHGNYFEVNEVEWIFPGVLLMGTLIVTYFLYWLLITPRNWTKDLTEVGYHFAGKKQSAINRVRRLRHVGKKLPPPFPNGWIAIIESKHVKVNKAITVACIGENFVVYRTEKNQVHVFDAYCPHLGANLGVGGIVRGDCIECPFHRWAFRGSDGQCVSVPYSISGAAPKTAKLKKWTSMEVNGSIFVWHHREDCQPWHLPVVEEISLGKWVYQGRNEFLINCHIQEIPENGADIAHLNAVHGPSLLGGSDIRFSRSRWISFGSHGWEAKWEPNEEEEGKHIAIMTLKHTTRIFNKYEIGSIEVCAKQVGPAYVQLFLETTFGSLVILQTVTPVEPLVQKVIHRFYGPRYMMPFMKFLIWAESVMFERDVMVWNQKCYMDSPCLVKEDRAIKLYRTWYSQFYSENSKSFSEAKETCDW